MPLNEGFLSFSCLTNKPCSLREIGICILTIYFTKTMFDVLTEGDFYEVPSFQVALFSIFLSFVLSSILSFTYHYTSKSSLSRNFVQAMILSSIVTCMVIMAVGNNVAAGFGIMGAIAIVRFRMRVENPRNIIFIFASLSIGIAAGVYGYSIAVAGTLVFCLVALVLFISPYGTKVLDKEFMLEFLLLTDVPDGIMKGILTSRCKDYRMISISNRTRGNRHEFFITLNEKTTKEAFYAELLNHEGIENVKLERSDNLTRL